MGQLATIGGQELGAEAEAAVQEADRLEALRSAKTRGEEQRQAEESERVADAADATAASSSGRQSAEAAGSGDVSGSPSAEAQVCPPCVPEGHSRGRGPDLVPRERRAWRSTGQNPENPSDWTNFDIGRVVRLFRTGGVGAHRLTLRKLHVRWWHASAAVMRRFLERVGVPDEILNLIPEICDTCKVCRMWAAPGPNNVCSVDIPDTFNKQVECDLLFIHKHIIFHMLDRCTRWHAGMLIPDKFEETLTNAIHLCWVGIHGPMKEFILDGESGIVVSELTNTYLRRHGIELRGRVKDQHARYVERRGALLRDTVHRIESQLEEEGIVIPFGQILAEAIFCGNALLTIRDSTPYNAVYGRVPRILPGIDQIAEPNSSQEPLPGLIRDANRLREVSVQAMIEGSAAARLGRAMNTRTTMSAQHLGLKVGDEVDFYQDQLNKDTSGWFGPAIVADVSRLKHGALTVRYNNMLREVSVQKVRRHLFFL